jgi:hypothetical protein
LNLQYKRLCNLSELKIESKEYEEYSLLATQLKGKCTTVVNWSKGFPMQYPRGSPLIGKMIGAPNLSFVLTMRIQDMESPIATIGIKELMEI